MFALVAAALASPPTLHSVHQVGIAMFPEGLQYYFEGEARVPLWGSDHVLLKDAHVAFGGRAEITPAYPRAGPIVRFAPVAFWDATFHLYGTWFFGTFSSILPFEDPEFRATKENKREMIEAGQNQGGFGVRVDAETRLKGKAGPVIAVIELQYRHHVVDTYAGGLEWYWDPTEMLNVSATGEVFNRNAFLFVELVKPTSADDRKLWVGAVGMWQTSLQSGDENVRLGPLVFWKPSPKPGVPTFLVGAQAWVESGFAATFPPYTFAAATWTR